MYRNARGSHYNQDNQIMKNNNLLIIFTRNPELGKCKTRLAATIGDEAALDVYTFLLNHTVSITAPIDASKRVYYSEKLRNNDIWDAATFQKHVQQGDGLGERMQHAFEEGFAAGYEHICIIGSDMYDLTSLELDQAFIELKHHDAVIGPATDGGYYLLGLNTSNPALFKNKVWGTDTVLESTLNDLQDLKVAVLKEKNDVDYYDDIKDIDAFQPFLNATKV